MGQQQAQGKQQRIVVLVVLLGLLVTSGYMNYQNANRPEEVSGQLPVVRIISDPPQRETTPAASGTPAPSEVQTLADFVSERADSRAQEIEMLDGIIDDPSSTAQIVAQAQEQKLAIVSNMEKENSLETILKARGFSQAAASVSGSSTTVIIGAAALTDAQLTQVLDLAVRETGAKAENIKIIVRK